jgi:DnaK suppressor protein
MAVKKPSVKATRAKKTAPKKTIAKASAPAKKAAPTKKPIVPAARKSTPVKPAKAASKSPAKVSATSVTPPKPVKAPVASEATEATEVTATPELETAQTSSPSAAKAAPARSVSVRNATVDTDDSDDNDPDLSTNLLAGPRNVQPYIPRRGEQYMSKEQLEHFRNILENWKRDLMQEVDRTVLHMKDEAANFPDPNDRATQESEFSLELRTRDRERKLIRKIEEAIKRIDDGTYGYCVETGEEIGIKRLEARPVATLCVEAQERRERREKQYGDRDDRYR